jgi:beta-glucosidase
MKKKALIILITCLSLACQQPNGFPTRSAKVSSVDRIDFKVDSLLSLMTLEEKIGQMNQYNGFYDATGPLPESGDAVDKLQDLRNGLVGSMLNVDGVKSVKALQKIAVEESRLGIPLIIAYDVIHGYKTMAPIPLAESCSWDLEAIKQSAEVAALEASASGINWTFAPMVDVSRDARWGRVMEGAGEDPFLGAVIAKARVQGFQGKDLSEPHTIAACAKHFAAYGFIESGREYNTVDIGTSTLNNVVYPPFKASVDAGVRTFMNAFNQLNGIPATGSAELQRQILKDDWGFDGLVVSDWGSISEMVSHGYAVDDAQAAEFAANAGSDIDMESHAYVKYLATAVQQGRVAESVIDDAVQRILRVKFELGLFDDPYRYCDTSRESEVIGSTAVNAAVLDIAKKSVVLLKNNNNLLPLKKSGQKIALIGPLANDKSSPLGNWRARANEGSAVSVLEGMQSYKGNTVFHEQGVVLSNTNPMRFEGRLSINQSDRSGIDAAIKAAEKADVVVMVLGELAFQSGEGRSRAKIDLPGLQQELLEAVHKVNPNIVLVLNNGRPLTLNWADANVPAIVEAWHLGTQSGNAIAQILYGDYNPSGKLTMTFPKSVGQVPIYYNHKSTGRPHDTGGAFWSHYEDESNDPLYVFGHGLSYTTFQYNNLKVENTNPATVKVTVELTNTGSIFGKEVVQLYVRDHFASVARPIKELKGFELVPLEPKESKTISFLLSKDELGFFNNQGKFIFEPGLFSFFIGGSSQTDLQTTIEIL